MQTQEEAESRENTKIVQNRHIFMHGFWILGSDANVPEYTKVNAYKDMRIDIYI